MGDERAEIPRQNRPAHTPLGRRLITAAGEALAHTQGKLELPSYEIDVPELRRVKSMSPL